jgi:hypothetical protein
VAIDQMPMSNVAPGDTSLKASHESIALNEAADRKKNTVHHAI